MSKVISNKQLIFQAKVADDMIELGEKLLYIREDLKDKTKSVFVFADSPTFQENKVMVLARYGFLK